MEKEAIKRYQNAGDLKDELEIYLHGLELTTTAELQQVKDYDKVGLIQLLKKNYSFFSEFTDDELKQIFKISNKKVYEKGEVIFKEDTVGSSMYIIIGGNINIVKTMDNERVCLNKLKEGDCFGEMAIIDSSPRSATAEAASRCVLMAISEVILRNSEPKLCLKLFRNLMSILSEKLRKSDHKVNALRQELKKYEKKASLNQRER
jgi:serine/threonine-protein kinase